MSIPAASMSSSRCSPNCDSLAIRRPIGESELNPASLWNANTASELPSGGKR